MHIFKGFEDQSDTYHDTQTHYLMEQDSFLLQDQVKVKDVVVADTTTLGANYDEILQRFKISSYFFFLFLD
jgi:hypothetical protein